MSEQGNLRTTALEETPVYSQPDDRSQILVNLRYKSIVVLDPSNDTQGWIAVQDGQGQTGFLQDFIPLNIMKKPGELMKSGIMSIIGIPLLGIVVMVLNTIMMLFIGYYFPMLYLVGIVMLCWGPYKGFQEFNKAKKNKQMLNQLNGQDFNSMAVTTMTRQTPVKLDRFDIPKNILYKAKFMHITELTPTILYMTPNSVKRGMVGVSPDVYQALERYGRQLDSSALIYTEEIDLVEAVYDLHVLLPQMHTYLKIHSHIPGLPRFPGRMALKIEIYSPDPQLIKELAATAMGVYNKNWEKRVKWDVLTKEYGVDPEEAVNAWNSILS